MALSAIDQEQVDRLYNLLHRAEQEKDQDTAAALRWAIFQLEQQGREKQTGDLVFRLAFTPAEEINSIMNTGAFNEIVKGYLVTTLQAKGTDHGDILEAVDTLDTIFDDTDAAQARAAYKKIYN